MQRRLEDRITALCAKAVSMTESHALEELIKELRTALKEQSQRARKKLLGGVPEHPKKRITD